MSTVFLTGSHPRHAAMARTIFDSGSLEALVIERREDHVPMPPPDLSQKLNRLFMLHFERREASESEHFGKSQFPDVPTLIIERNELNGDHVRKWLQQFHPDLLLSYGVHLLDERILQIPNRKSWNIHGGLSPWYRGVITHFWPSYFLEPQFTGMTVHETTDAVDGGAIIHQTRAELVRGDGIHDLSCRAVRSLLPDISRLLRAFHDSATITPQPQTTTGRIWRSADWRPEHLRQIYDFYDDSIVDLYLNGEFSQREPRLLRQQIVTE